MNTCSAVNLIIAITVGFCSFAICASVPLAMWLRSKRDDKQHIEFDRLLEGRQADKCGNNRCYDRSEYCSCRQWAEERA